MRYKISDDNIRIYDSYQITSIPQIARAIVQLRAAENRGQKVWQRTNRSLILEWAGHNLLYRWVPKWRSHTKDVDMDYPQTFWTRTAFNILGTLYACFHFK